MTDKNEVCATTVFEEFSANARHYSGLRFVIFSGWLVLVGTLANIVIERCAKTNPGLILMAAGLGPTFTGAAIAIEFRVNAYINFYKDELQYLVRQRPDKSELKTHRAVLWVYVLGIVVFLVFGFWIFFSGNCALPDCPSDATHIGNS